MGICFPLEKLSYSLKCIKMLEGKGGVTITLFQLTNDENWTSYVKKTPLKKFVVNLVMFRPNLDMCIDVCRLPDPYKKNADTKLTVVRWCPICYGKSIAPSSATAVGIVYRRARKGGVPH